MLTALIISVLISIIVYFTLEDELDRISAIITSITASLIASFFIISLISVALPTKPIIDISTTTTTQTLHSLKASNEIHGKHFLISGYIDEELYYYYYIQNPDSSFIFQKRQASKSYIYYTDSIPHIDITITKYLQPRDILWKIQFANKFSDIKYKFYIPRNSIISDYTL